MIEMSELIAGNGLEAMLGHISAVVVLLENDGTLVWWNTAFDPYKKTLPLANNLLEFFPQQDKHTLISRLSTNTQERWSAELLMNGACVGYYDCLIIPQPNKRFIFIAEPVEVKETIEHLNRQVKLFRIESESAKKIARNKQIEMEGVMTQASELAQIDPLTFLFNRRTIVKKIQDEVLRAKRYNSMLSVSMVDVDHFKSVNDTYGHLVGDEVLRKIAYQLQEHVRQPDVIGRYGGEEFLIILPNSSAKAAIEQASRLCKQMRDMTVDIYEHSLKVTISIGIAQFQAEEDTWETLLKRADAALYEAKNSGRDRWVVAA